MLKPPVPNNGKRTASIGGLTPCTALTNVHVHLFTADHIPTIQLYYILRGFLLRSRLVGAYIESIERWRWFLPKILFNLAYAISWAFPRLCRRDLEGFLRFIFSISRVTRQDMAAILGTGGPITVHALLRYFKAQLGVQSGRYPLRDCLKQLAREISECNETRDSDLSQQALLTAFVAEQGGRPLYTRVAVLTMNFDVCFSNVYETGFSEAQRRPRIQFKEQAKELLSLSRSTNDIEILPFLCLDPRSALGKPLDSVEKYIGDGFRGLKIYPSLGYLPTDPRLELVFDYCYEHRIPVITHCSPIGAGVKGAVNCSDFAHPYNWVPVLNRLKTGYDKYVPRRIRSDRFRTEILAPAGEGCPEILRAYREPTTEDGYLLKATTHDDEKRTIARFLRSIGYFKFKLCFAHFGHLEKKETGSWRDEVVEIIKHYANCPDLELYADISSFLPQGRRAKRRYVKAMVEVLDDPSLRKRVLYGSDWWMYRFERTEAEYYQFHFDGEIGSKLPSGADSHSLGDVFEQNAEAFLSNAFCHETVGNDSVASTH